MDTDKDVDLESGLDIDEDMESSDADDTGKKGYKRLTAEEFIEASVKWRSGKYKLKELAEEYGVSENSLWRRFDRNGVKHAVDLAAFESQVRTAMLEETHNATLEREQRLRKQALDSKEFLLKAVDGVSRRGLNAIAETVKNKLPLANAMDDVKTAKEAILLFKNAVETIDRIVPKEEVDEDDLPTLSIEGLTVDDVDAIRQEHKDTQRMFGDFDEGDDLGALDGK